MFRNCNKKKTHKFRGQYELFYIFLTEMDS